MFISHIGVKFSFFVMFLSGFGIRMILASQKEFGSLPSSWIFWNNLWRIGVSFPLNVLQNSPVKPSGPGLLCVRSFLIIVSISSGVIGLFSLFAASSLSFGRLYIFQKFVHFIQVFTFLGIEFFIVSSYNPLYFCGISCILPLSFLIVFIWVSLFFS